MIFVCISRGFFFPQLSQCIFTSGTRAVSGGNNTFSAKQRFPHPLLAQLGRGGRAAQESRVRSIPAPITRCSMTRTASPGLIPPVRGDPCRVLHHLMPQISRCHRGAVSLEDHPCPGHLHSPSQPQHPTSCTHSQGPSHQDQGTGWCLSAGL